MKNEFTSYKEFLRPSSLKAFSSFCAILIRRKSLAFLTLESIADTLEHTKMCFRID